MKNGTPSCVKSSNSMPWKWTPVDAGRLLVNVIRTLSPSMTRIVGPGPGLVVAERLHGWQEGVDGPVDLVDREREHLGAVDVHADGLERLVALDDLGELGVVGVGALDVVEERGHARGARRGCRRTGGPGPGRRSRARSSPPAGSGSAGASGWAPRTATPPGSARGSATASGSRRRPRRRPTTARPSPGTRRGSRPCPRRRRRRRCAGSHGGSRATGTARAGRTTTSRRGLDGLGGRFCGGVHGQAPGGMTGGRDPGGAGC